MRSSRPAGSSLTMTCSLMVASRRGEASIYQKRWLGFLGYLAVLLHGVATGWGGGSRLWGLPIRRGAKTIVFAPCWAALASAEDDLALPDFSERWSSRARSSSEEASAVQQGAITIVF